MRVSVLAARVRRPARRPAPPSELEQALVDLGLEVEAIVDLRAHGHRPAGGRPGPATIEELTGFKKPIRLLPGRRRRRNGTGEPQEIVCGATQLRRGRPGRGDPARRRAARRVRDRRAQDLRPHLRRHDLLGAASWASATTTPASSCCPPDVAAQPGDDARPVVGLDDVVVELEITPDRGYALSVRGIARELSHALRRAVPRPGRRAARPARPPSRPYPVDGRATRSAATGSPRAWCAASTRPRRRPAWMRARLTIAGVRSISPRRRHHQLPDARARPADARVRPGPAARPAGGAAGRAGGDS